MAGPNPYEVLNVPRDATVEEIEDAYDTLFDRYEAGAQAGNQDAISMLNTLNDARDALVDPKQRAALDRSLAKSPGRDSKPAADSVAQPPARPSRPTAQRPTQGGGRAPSSQRSTTVRTRPRSRVVSTRRPRTLASLLPFFIIIVFLVFAIAVAVTYLLNGANTAATGSDPTAVVATVNNQPIYQDDYQDQVSKDKTNALNDPLFGTLFNNFQGVTGTRALQELEFDSLDKLINMQVILQEAKKEGLYPTEPQIDNMVTQAQQNDLQNGQSFNDFLKAHNLTADRYRRAVTANVVYSVMADQHMPKTGTADEKTQGFIEWMCTTRKNFDVKILINFTITDNPSCTSGLPSDLPLPGVDETPVPGPEATQQPGVAPVATVPGTVAPTKP